MTSTYLTNHLSAVVALAAQTLDSPPDDVKFDKVTGDASTREYFRARIGNRSVIAVLYSEPFDERISAVERLAELEISNPAARLTFANDPRAHIETTSLFLEAGVPVPRIVGVSGDEGALLLEDVGDTRLQDWLSSKTNEQVVAAYRRALEVLIQIQDATRFVLERHSICSILEFDEAKLRWELGFFFANYVNKHLRLKLSPAMANSVQAEFKELCSELASRPRVFTHRDYHARNLMIKDEEMFVIDFQDARMGPTSYDVASLLSDPYSPLDRASADQLTREFVEMKSRSKLPIEDLRDFEIELQLMTVQRMLKVIGTYASQAVAGNPIYLPYIAPAKERALSALAALNRFSAIRSLLESAER